MNDHMRRFGDYVFYSIVIAGICGAVNYLAGSEIVNIYETIACVALARTIK